jgi:hypothetical protein
LIWRCTFHHHLVPFNLQFTLSEHAHVAWKEGKKFSLPACCMRAPPSPHSSLFEFGADARLERPLLTRLYFMQDKYALFSSCQLPRRHRRGRDNFA